MNKSELITSTAALTGLSRKDTERILNTALECIAQALTERDKVQLSGFGCFEVKYREPRVGRNPHTKEPVEIPATWVPVFKASKALRDTVAE